MKTVNPVMGNSGLTRVSPEVGENWEGNFRNGHG